MDILKKYGQEHLIKYVDRLSEGEKEELLTSIKSIDFALMKRVYEERVTARDEQKGALKPLVPTRVEGNLKDEYMKLGLEAIGKGQVAVVLMAGGQGTRLGHTGPKGTFDIGLPSGKSLFHIQSDKLKRLYDMTGTYIKWYIMTSDDNHEATMSHFEAHNYFSYDPNSVVFFKQDRLPLVLEDGKVAMKSPFEINLAANGNGGVFSSLKSQGLIDQMETDGVKWVFLYGVDNILTKIADPTFVGFTIASGCPVSSKAVDKAYPEEKVGVICYRDGHPDIVEYSEMDEEAKNLRDQEGKLMYRNSNILSHMFSFDFLKECVNKSLPYHVAHKKVNHFDEELIVASEPNGYKYELFMFDVFEYANDLAVMTVEREEEFAPVKNKEGKDSPESARNYIYDLHRKWLLEAGYTLENGKVYEVKSYLSYEGENLSGRILEEIVE